MLEECVEFDKKEKFSVFARNRAANSHMLHPKLDINLMMILFIWDTFDFGSGLHLKSSVGGILTDIGSCQGLISATQRFPQTPVWQPLTLPRAPEGSLTALWQPQGQIYFAQEWGS